MGEKNFTFLELLLRPKSRGTLNQKVKKIAFRVTFLTFTAGVRKKNLKNLEIFHPRMTKPVLLKILLREKKNFTFPELFLRPNYLLACKIRPKK